MKFTVFGTPRPQGSMRAFMPKGGRYPSVTTDNRKLKPWRQEISATAMEFREHAFEQGVPVEVIMNFYFTRPKSAKKRLGMTVKPDADKLVRAVFDAIKGILIHDDAQIIEHHCRKHYGGPERVEIEITEAIA